MSRNRTISVAFVMAFAVLNGALIMWVALRPPKNAEETQAVRSSIKHSASMIKGSHIDMIGSLTSNSYWTESLPLAEEQNGAIAKLDVLVREAVYRSMIADTELFADSPTRHLKEYERRGERRKEVTRHARLLVTSGLLTKEQSDFVLAKHLEAWQFDALYDDVDADRLGVTASQKEKLAASLGAYRKVYYALPAVSKKSLDPADQREYHAVKASLAKKHTAEIKGILTPAQLETWSRLTAKRTLSGRPPDLSPKASSVGDAGGVELRDLSPTFGALLESSKSIGLSPEQERLVADLVDVTRKGVAWIGLGAPEGSPHFEVDRKSAADRIRQSRLEFVKHAEQVALLGILTEPQAEKLQAMIRARVRVAGPLETRRSPSSSPFSEAGRHALSFGEESGLTLLESVPGERARLTREGRLRVPGEARPEAILA